MKNLLYLSFLVLFSCSSKKPQEQCLLYGNDINLIAIDLRNSTGFPFPYNGSYQTDSTKIVFDCYIDKFGLQDYKGNDILKREYEGILFLDNERLLIQKNDLLGVVDRFGNSILPTTYKEIYPFINEENKSLFLLVTNSDYKQAIFNHNGNEIYPFTINYLTESVIYKNKVFLVTDEDNYTKKMLKVSNGKIEIFSDYVYNFIQIKDNLATLYYNQNGTAYQGFYNMENDSILYGFDRYYYHKPKNEIWATSKKSGYKNYDVIIDSSFTVKPNKYANTTRITNDYFYLKAENGYQIMDLYDNILPFSYPVIQPFDGDIRADIHGKDYAETRKNLFKFYTNAESKRYGVIDNNGKILVPADTYDVINLNNVNNRYSHYNNISHNKKEYLKEKKLDRIFYVYERDENTKNILLDVNGNEIIATDKGYYVDLERFSFHNHLLAQKRDTIKVYDLDIKKVVYVASGLGVGHNFTELYPDGYRYYKPADEPDLTEVTYLGNKLNVLYQTKVRSDSLHYKLPIRGDKVFFKKEGKTGLINFKEEEIVPAKYDQITMPNSDYNIVKQNGKFGVITNNNEIVIDIIYDKIEFQINVQSFNCYLNDQMERIYIGRLKRK